MLQALIGPVANLAGTWMQNRAEKAQAKQKLAVAKIEAQTKKVEQDGAWELEQARASQDSWKDELWTVFFVILLSACFYPPAQPYIEDGFVFKRRPSRMAELVNHGKYCRFIWLEVNRKNKRLNLCDYRITSRYLN